MKKHELLRRFGRGEQCIVVDLPDDETLCKYYGYAIDKVTESVIVDLRERFIEEQLI